MPTTENLYTFSWPIARLGEALEQLAQTSGLGVSPVSRAPFPEPPTRADDPHLGAWLETSAGWLGIEAEPIETPYPDIEALVQGAGPALLYLPGDSARFLALLEGSRRTVTLLDPDLNQRRLPVTVVCAALRQPLEAPLVAEVDHLLDEVGVSGRRRTQARQVILRERLSSVRLQAGWLLRLQPGNNLKAQLYQARLPQRLLAFLGVYTLHYFIWLLAWWVVGHTALQGRFDQGWLVAWGLLLLSLIPVQLLATWWQGQLALKAGTLLKQHLLAGALRLLPEEVRHQGAGQFLGQVIESEAVETLALNGGLLGLMAGLELLVAATILGAGAGGMVQLSLLLGWLALTAWLGWRYFTQRRAWTKTRLGMTHELVERMVGHRTRLAQEAPHRWHSGEDGELAAYLGHSQQMDQMTSRLVILVPRGWLGLGLVGLIPTFVAGGNNSAGLAVSLGGMLLIYQALRKLVPSLLSLADAAIAWRQVETLFRAAARLKQPGAPAFTLKPAPAQVETEGAPLAPTPLIEANNLVFRHRQAGEPVLQGCHLRLQAGDRLLLEGPSGGGKSTLAMGLAGLRRPEAGLLLLHGHDAQSWGDIGWRQRVAAAPQFHENHVLTETFAFNLLMGREWPPRPGDIEAAAAICEELGLGDLIQRMPAGLLQMVGETGWQLSHGERSRLYLARALLQEADLTILDEAFAALDPETMRRALHCALNRARTLLVIAHP